MIDLYKLDKFLAESLDKGFLSSATTIEGINKTVYKIQSDNTELILHVKENEALIQNMKDSETLFHLHSRVIDNPLCRLVSQAVSKPKTYYTPFGVYSNVVIAPVERRPVILSSRGSDWTQYKDVFSFVTEDDGGILIYLLFQEDWVLVGHSNTEAEALSIVDNFLRSAEVGETSFTGEEEFFEDQMMDLVTRYIRNPSLENIPIMESVVFEDSNQKQWIVSQEEARITLGLYDLLVDSTSEHAILMLPSLYPSNSPKVTLQSSTSSKSVRDDIISSYSLMSSPASVPFIGTRTSLERIVSSADREKIQRNSKAFNNFYRSRDISSRNYEKLFSTHIGEQSDPEEFELFIDEAEAASSVKGFLDINNHSGYTESQLTEFYDKVNSKVVEGKKSFKISDKKFLENKKNVKSSKIGKTLPESDLDFEFEDAKRYNSAEHYVFSKGEASSKMSKFTDKQLEEFYKTVTSRSKAKKKNLQSVAVKDTYVGNVLVGTELQQAIDEVGKFTSPDKFEEVKSNDSSKLSNFTDKQRTEFYNAVKLKSRAIRKQQIKSGIGEARTTFVGKDIDPSLLMNLIHMGFKRSEEKFKEEFKDSSYTAEQLSEFYKALHSGAKREKEKKIKIKSNEVGKDTVEDPFENEFDEFLKKEGEEYDLPPSEDFDFSVGWRSLPKNKIKRGVVEARATHMGKKLEPSDFRELVCMAIKSSEEDFNKELKSSFPKGIFTSTQISEFYQTIYSSIKLPIKKSLHSNKEKEKKETEDPELHYMANFFRVNKNHKKKLIETFGVKGKFDAEDLKDFTENQQEALKSVKNKSELKEILELGTGLC